MIDKAILDFLDRNPRGAVWKTLKLVRPDKPLQDSVLKKAVDRLVEDHMLETHTERRKGGAVTIYMLKRAATPISKDGQALVFPIWLQNVTKRLKEMQRPDVGYTFYDKVPGFEKEPGSNVDKGQVLSTAAWWIAVIILDRIKDASHIHDEGERTKYLDRVSGDYLRNLIICMARFASLTPGDTDRAVDIAEQNLDWSDLLHRVSVDYKIMIDIDGKGTMVPLHETW